MEVHRYEGKLKKSLKSWPTTLTKLQCTTSITSSHSPQCLLSDNEQCAQPFDKREHYILSQAEHKVKWKATLPTSETKMGYEVSILNFTDSFARLHLQALMSQVTLCHQKVSSLTKQKYKVLLIFSFLFTDYNVIWHTLKMAQLFYMYVCVSLLLLVSKNKLKQNDLLNSFFCQFSCYEEATWM